MLFVLRCALSCLSSVCQVLQLGLKVGAGRVFRLSRSRSWEKVDCRGRDSRVLTTQPRPVVDSIRVFNDFSFFIFLLRFLLTIFSVHLA